jgi:GT2 family glycosyltransferase
MARVSIVVLNWNGLDDTLSCIEGFQKQNLKNIKIVVVDNGSIDGSVGILREYVSENKNIELILNNKNLGFAGGVNKGIDWSINHDYEYVALINNDALIKKGWLDQLLIPMNDVGIGITTGLLLNESGDQIDSSGDWYSKWGLAFPRNRNDKRSKAPSSGMVFGATGGASLYRVSMLKEIGLFDEDFFAYYEDVDLSFRAQLAGWKIHFNKKAIAYHKRGATSKKIPGFTTDQTFKNLPLLFIKNVPIELFFSIGIRLKLAYFLMLSKAIIHGEGYYAIKGCFASCLLIYKKMIERRSIQKKKKVDATYIKSILWDDLPPDQTGLRKFRDLFLIK